MNWKLPTAIILFLVAGWFYQQHEHVKFNYEGSYWEQLDQKLDKPWFKNNSRPEIRNHWFWKYLPFTFDGYHAFSWLMKYCYFIMFAIYLYEEEPYWWFVAFIGLLMAFGNFFLSQLTYGLTFV